MKLRFPNAYRLWMTLHGSSPVRIFVPTVEILPLGALARLEVCVPERAPLELEVKVVERRPAGGRFDAGLFVELTGEQVGQCRELIGIGWEIPPSEPHFVEGERRQPVVVGDDDPVILSFLERALARFGFDIFSVDNGEAALKLVEELRPRLVLLDVVMPGLDGSEVCRRMRRVESLAPIPVVLVSALSEEELSHIADEAGANDFLTKPMELSELINVVGGYLRADSEERAGTAPSP